MTGFTTGIGVTIVPAEDRIDIIDPVSAYAYTLDTKHRVAHRCKLASVRTLRLSGIRPPLGRDPDLETRIIEGITAYGSKSPGTQADGTPRFNVIETWWSTDLNETLLGKTTTRPSDEVTFRFVDVHRADPDATLFRVPQDYKILDD